MQENAKECHRLQQTTKATGATTGATGATTSASGATTGANGAATGDTDCHPLPKGARFCQMLPQCHRRPQITTANGDTTGATTIATDATTCATGATTD